MTGWGVAKVGRYRNEALPEWGVDCTTEQEIDDRVILSRA
jgi:hypothetical protein